MHDPSSVIRADGNFIEISRVFRNNQTSIKIANKNSFELLLYVAYRISESIARFGVTAFEDCYNSLFIWSIYNHVLDYVHIKDRYGEGVKIDIPINISWYTRRWVSKDARDLIARDGKLLDSIKPIKQTMNPNMEQYDYVFEEDKEIYVIPNELLLQKRFDIGPILLTEVFLENFPIYSNLKIGTIEYEE